MQSTKFKNKPSQPEVNLAIQVPWVWAFLPRVEASFLRDPNHRNGPGARAISVSWTRFSLWASAEMLAHS